MKAFEIYSVTNGIDNLDVVTIEELKQFDTAETQALKSVLEQLEALDIDETYLFYDRAQNMDIEVTRVE